MRRNLYLAPRLIGREQWKDLYHLSRAEHRAHRIMTAKTGVTIEERLRAVNELHRVGDLWTETLDAITSGDERVKRRLNGGPHMLCNYAGRRARRLEQFSPAELLAARLYAFKRQKQLPATEPVAYQAWKDHCEHPEYGLSAKQLVDLVERFEWKHGIIGRHWHGTPLPRQLP